MKNSYLYTFALILISFFATAHAFAAQNYSVLPLVIDETLEGRDIVTRDITITNNGMSPVTVYPTVNNISLKEGGKIEEFIQAVESDRTTSLASWLEISRLGIDLTPGESKIIPLTFRIHQTPAPGVYHALIGFGTGSHRGEAEKMVADGLAPGTVVTVTIEDKKNEFLKLSKFIISRFVTRTENQAAVFTFVNPGGETLVPTGEIILYDGTGKEVAALPVNSDNTPIPPGEEHSFTAEVPIDGLFGKYKAFLSVEYGTTQRASVQDTSFFYIFPLKILLIILGILVFVVIGVAWHVHKKYLDTETDIDDSERLTVHVRDGVSEAQHHDIDLKNKP